MLFRSQVSGKEDATTVLNPPSKGTPIFDRPFRRQIGWLIGACLLVAASSSGIGWAMRTPDLLLVESKGQSKVTLMPTADGQLYYAISNPHDEKTWISVLNFVGASDEMQARANTALGLIYLKTNRRPRAEITFNDLATQSKYKANGLAGLALHAELNGEADRARKLMAQIDGMDAKLFPEIDGALKDLQKRLKPAN